MNSTITVRVGQTQESLVNTVEAPRLSQVKVYRPSVVGGARLDFQCRVVCLLVGCVVDVVGFSCCLGIGTEVRCVCVTALPAVCRRGAYTFVSRCRTIGACPIFLTTVQVLHITRLVVDGVDLYVAATGLAGENLQPRCTVDVATIIARACIFVNINRWCFQFLKLAGLRVSAVIIHDACDSV